MTELPKHGTGIHKVEYETKDDGTVTITKVEFEAKEKEKHSYGFIKDDTDD